jgi:hypothetical protein
MNRNESPPVAQPDLEASLRRLGVRELEERMEISPLLAGAGIEDTAVEAPVICCTCKMPPPENLPYPTMLPTPTGPTNPVGWPL